MIWRRESWLEFLRRWRSSAKCGGDGWRLDQLLSHDFDFELLFIPFLHHISFSLNMYLSESFHFSHDYTSLLKNAFLFS